MKKTLQNKSMVANISAKLAILGCAGLLLAGGNAMATDSTATTNVATAATVVTPMAITAATALNFGTFAASATAGTLAMSTTNVRTPTNVTLIATNGGAASSITVAGAVGATFTVVLPIADQTLTSSGSSMTIKSASFASSLSLNQGVVGAGGSATFTIGATLTVAASQPTGVYSGTYPIYLTYN
jgi:hypothetical protein